MLKTREKKGWGGITTEFWKKINRFYRVPEITWFALTEPPGQHLTVITAGWVGLPETTTD